MFERIKLSFIPELYEEFLEFKINENISLRIVEENSHFKLEVIGLEYTETHSEQETLKIAIKIIYDLINVAKEKGIDNYLSLMEII